MRRSTNGSEQRSSRRAPNERISKQSQNGGANNPSLPPPPHFGLLEARAPVPEKAAVVHSSARPPARLKWRPTIAERKPR